MVIKNPVLREIVRDLLKQKSLTPKSTEKIVREVCRKYGPTDMPTNVQILQACTDEEKKKLKRTLLMKPVRSISGVTIITVVTKPVPCTWGACIYCPKGNNAPQSYTGLEPAIQRAIRNNYDPYLQVQDRLNQYRLMGHLHQMGNKCEIIILGGTFLALDRDYKEWFVKRIFDGLNEEESATLGEAQKLNERAENRCTNLTIETRPDYSKKDHVDEMLRLGVTRVEIGVQTIYPDVLRAINRGHTLEDVIEATGIARNAGLKITHHYMPFLPGSDADRDLEMFKAIFKDQNFRPDYLKIYPTIVVEGTMLYEMWKVGKYKSYSSEELIDLLVKIKRHIPKYCRIQRLGRAVPSTDVEAGYKETNIREMVLAKAKKLGMSCKCIRCREVGFSMKQGVYPDVKRIRLVRMNYEAFGGDEIFLSFDDTKNDIIIGFLRMRVPKESHRPEIDSRTALVRELKVMGVVVPVGLSPRELEWQHRGYAKQLMEKAEEMASNEFDSKKMVVISAIGTKGYYRNLGYMEDGPYVSKAL